MAKAKFTKSRQEVKPREIQLVIEAPRTGRELLRVGYAYSGGDDFIDGQFLPENENVMNWEGQMHWVLDREDYRGDLPREIHTRVRMRIEFLDITVPDEK